MEDYRKYLAEQILTEDKVVTYRLLSRALKVHVNTAKEMLYDFHKWQNDKKPGSLYATYLVYGIARKAEEHDGDVEMTDSQQSEAGPIHEPLSDAVVTHTLSLVEEEKLQEVLGQYEEVTAIHVYSIAPQPQKDLHLLADAAQEVVKMSLAEDSPNAGKIYGTPSNSNVRRRERRAGLPKPTQAGQPADQKQVKPEPKPRVKEEPKESKASVAKETGAPKAFNSRKSATAPGLKRQGSSGGISQMFAKAAAKPKKTSAKSSAASTPKEAPSPALSDEGEDDSEMPDIKPDPEAAKARSARQAALRAMMDEESDEEPEKGESLADEPMEEEPPPAEPEPKAEEGPSEIVSSTGNGRRRGRRRVTRKKQIMDDQGYLVTVHEQGWESFSEDETPPPAHKQKPAAEKQTPAAKPKKGGKAGQGNIMSFFSKK